MDYVKSIITHPACFAGAVGEGDPATWEPNVGPYVAWLRAPGAAFMLYPLTALLWECHSAVIPEFRKHTKAYYAAVREWIGDNTTCRHLIGMIAEGNWKAQRAAEAAGMKREGFLPNSKLYRGQIVGTHVYGIEV